MGNDKSSSSGISVLGVLGIVFVVLKLTHLIDWPWLWVLAPFWAGIAVVLAVVLIFAIIKSIVSWK